MQSLDFDSARLARVVDTLRADIARGEYFGAALIVSRGGRIAINETLGACDAHRRRAVTQDCLFPLMSISKSLAAVLMLARVESGAIALTTAVADVIPEFGANGKQAITVAQLLSHTGGLGDETPPGHDAESPQEILARICRAPLRSRPGQFAYSGEAGYFIVGELLRRLDRRQRSVGEQLAEDLLRPLGMNDTFLVTTAALRSRRVPIAVVAETKGMYATHQLLALEEAFANGQEEPGGSVIGTAQDLHRFARMLAAGGTIDGARILSARMVGLATQIHTGEDDFGVMQFGRQLLGWPTLRANYGLGFQMRGPVAFQPSQHGTLASAGTFGHRGAGLTCFWVDPQTDVTFVCLTAGFLDESKSSERWQRLSDIVHSSIVD